MKTPIKILIVVALALVVVVALAFKHGKAGAESESMTPSAVAGRSAADPATKTNPPARISLPRLVDLGADKCIPCKMMAPILAELQRDYADRFTTEFIDVWKNPDAGTQYGIRVIPTQIFYDAEGKERFRHEGFFGKDDILDTWSELGVDLNARTSTPDAN
jgi:thioredoxin 1